MVKLKTIVIITGLILALAALSGVEAAEDKPAGRTVTVTKNSTGVNGGGCCCEE